VDPNVAFDDRGSVSPSSNSSNTCPKEIATGNIQRPQAPRNLALTLIGLGTLSTGRRYLAARNFLEKALTLQTQKTWSPRILCGDCRNPDRRHHLLRRAAASRTILGECNSAKATVYVAQGTTNLSVSWKQQAQRMQKEAFVLYFVFRTLAHPGT